MERKKLWYSIVRYSPDEIKGEVINVGLIMHNFSEEKDIIYYILDEKSSKIKALLTNKNEIALYKSFREIIEYYLSNCKDDLSGYVGSIKMGSIYSEDFLKNVYEYNLNKKMYLSSPQFAKTADINRLFNSLFDRYIGNDYKTTKKRTHITTKQYMRKLFKEKNLLGTKVESDIVIAPVAELENIKYKMDFQFKNGCNNYIYTIPALNSYNEWFAKTDIMLRHIMNNTNSKVNLLYRYSDLRNNEELFNIISYFSKNDNVYKINIDSKDETLQLCDYIEEHAENIAM